MNYVELDRKYFWKALKMTKSSNNNKSLAIKDCNDKVVHDLDDVLAI